MLWVQGIAFAGPLVCMLACAVLTPAAGAVTPRLTAMIVGILSGATFGVLQSSLLAHEVRAWRLGPYLIRTDRRNNHSPAAAVSFACGSFSRGGLYCVHQVHALHSHAATIAECRLSMLMNM